MLGGYNIEPKLIVLKIDELGEEAANALSETLLIFDSFNEIFELSKTNKYAKKVIDSWAAGEWFTKKLEIPEQIKLTVFKVPGEINTDDLSPATDAWSRPDIPLHALTAMFKMPREGLEKPLETIEKLKEKGNPLVFVGDVVGTGSSRKICHCSVLYMGDEIPCIPNKKEGGFVLEEKLLLFSLIL